MILIAIGANLPGPQGQTPRDTCAAAAAALSGLPGLRVAAISPWYETEPVPPSGQPPYINGVARLEGTADPAWLLGRLHAIEARFGRIRGAANAARTLDLDIIAMNGLVRDAPDPVLPHPRMHQRGFVLRPLADVAPGWTHPRLGHSVEALIAGLPPQGVELL